MITAIPAAATEQQSAGIAAPIGPSDAIPPEIAEVSCIKGASAYLTSGGDPKAAVLAYAKSVVDIYTGGIVVATQ